MVLYYDYLLKTAITLYELFIKAYPIALPVRFDERFETSANINQNPCFANSFWVHSHSSFASLSFLSIACVYSFPLPFGV